MKTACQEDNVLIPSYALSYLINGDASGLSDEDKAITDKWLSGWNARTEKVNGSLIITTVNEDYDDSDFHWNPEFGLPCNCNYCTIIILVED